MGDNGEGCIRGDIHTYRGEEKEEKDNAKQCGNAIEIKTGRSFDVCA